MECYLVRLAKEVACGPSLVVVTVVGQGSQFYTQRQRPRQTQRNKLNLTTAFKRFYFESQISKELQKNKKKNENKTKIKRKEENRRNIMRKL